MEYCQIQAANIKNARTTLKSSNRRKKMYDCTFQEEYNHCRFLRRENGEYLCTNSQEGCSFRAGEIHSEEGSGGAAQAYVRKERWYEEYYKDSRPVRENKGGMGP